MNRLIFALLMTVAGLALGFILFAMEWTLNVSGNWTWDFLSQTAPQLQVILIWIGRILGFGIIAGVIGLLLWVLWDGIVAVFLSSASANIQRRIEALRTVSQAVEAIKRDGEILSSEDGTFLNLVIRLPIDQWNCTKPFYHKGVACSPPKNTENYYYFYVFILNENDSMVTIPISFNSEENSCSLTIYFKIIGMRCTILKSLKWTHSAFSESNMGIVTTIVTGILVFFMSLIEKGAKDSFDRYCYHNLFPFLQRNIPYFEGPINGITFSHAEVKFNYSEKSALPPLFIELENKTAKEVLAAPSRGLMDRFRPFRYKLNCQLKWPHAE